YPVLYAEEVVDGEVMILQVGIFKDGPGNTMFAQLYNFTNDYNEFGALEYDYHQIEGFEMSQLWTDDECRAYFEIYDGLLTGTFPDCKFTNPDGTHPYFVLIYNCQHEIAVFPTNTNQKATDTPYVLDPSRDRFELNGDYDTFQSPCEPYKLKTQEAES
ncbi:unnamed protein product, partial [Candidula unifasciata]